jgi:hypothetical protein
MIAYFHELFRLLSLAVGISFSSSPHLSSPFSFVAALTMSVQHVLEAYFTCITQQPFFNVPLLMVSKMRHVENFGPANFFVSRTFKIFFF